MTKSRKRRRNTPSAAKSKLLALGLSESQLKKSKAAKLPPLSPLRVTGGGNGDTFAYGLPESHSIEELTNQEKIRSTQLAASKFSKENSTFIKDQIGLNEYFKAQDKIKDSSPTFYEVLHGYKIDQDLLKRLPQWNVCYASRWFLFRIWLKSLRSRFINRVLYGEMKDK